MSVKISRVLHAGYLIEYKNKKVLFDPIFENPFSVNCYAYPPIEFDIPALQKESFDAVIISHYHDDHFSVTSLNFIPRETPIYLFSFFSEHFAILREMGFREIYEIQWSKPFSIGELEIIPLRALDEDVDSIYHIKAENLNILNLVDSWIAPSTLDYLQTVAVWDLILWPFQTMREVEVIAPSATETSEDLTLPAEWLEQLSFLRPRILVPSSCQFRFEDWSFYNDLFFPISYASFTKEISALLPQTTIKKLNPGQSIRLSESEFESCANLDWVKSSDSPDRDYTYLQSTTIPRLSEIAKKFPSLNTTQKEQTSQFIENDLPQRWSHLNEDHTLFFSEPRYWQLSIYSGTGEERKYFFQLTSSSRALTLTQSDWSQSHWKTEISEYKLHRALFEGETLTSIYIRVSPAANYSPLEDPLLRVLYEGQVAAYQKAQFAKITKN